ncbi:MAG: hypothetical protein U0354_08830 [Candidatus Sericytochromatia bacterium]
MNQKQKIICLLISALIMSCSQVNVPITQESKAAPKPIQSQTVVVNTKPEIKTPTTPTPLSTLDPTNYNSSAIDKNLTPTPTVTPVPSTNFIQVVPTSTLVPIPSGISPPIVIVTGSLPPTTKYHNPDTIIKPIPEGTGTTQIAFYSLIYDAIGSYWNLTFKDIYRIRFSYEKQEFYSLSGYDTSSLNKIFKSENIRVFPKNSTYDANGKKIPMFTEEDMDNTEQDRQKSETGDVPHFGSEYLIATKDIENLAFGTLVRQHPYVRSFNFMENNVGASN